MALVTQDSSIVENVVMHGDLAELSPAARVAYYQRVCESLGLNPFTRPFEYIKLNGKLTLYARRDATDQLRAIKGVSIAITAREIIEGVYTVTARATIGTRSDESIGAVDIGNLKGDFRANAMMKAETKAKRRVTLSIVGLGWLDETEVSDIPKNDVKVVDVDIKTGEIIDQGKAPDAPPSVERTSEHINPQDMTMWADKASGKAQLILNVRGQKPMLKTDKNVVDWLTSGPHGVSKEQIEAEPLAVWERIKEQLY
jgi:hypothetical protein